jgi:hypothetical protein
MKRAVLWVLSLVLSTCLLVLLSNHRPPAVAPGARPAIPQPEFGGRALDAWKLARRAVEHEDGLVTDRLTAYLTLQGFLFAALGIIVKSYVEQYKATERIGLEVPLFLIAFGLVICTIGIISSIITNWGIQTAYDQNDAIEEWWKYYIGIRAQEVYHFLEAEEYKGYLFPRFRGRYPFPYVVECLPLYVMVSWNLLLHILLIWPSEPAKRELWRLAALVTGKSTPPRTGAVGMADLPAADLARPRAGSGKPLGSRPDAPPRSPARDQVLRDPRLAPDT